MTIGHIIIAIIAAFGLSACIIVTIVQVFSVSIVDAAIWFLVLRLCMRDICTFSVALGGGK